MLVLLSILKVDVFKDYFGELEEESIRDNFVIIYELLDETMDFGYPQTMESKILREYITQVSEISRHDHACYYKTSVCGTRCPAAKPQRRKRHVELCSSILWVRIHSRGDI